MHRALRIVAALSVVVALTAAWTAAAHTSVRRAVPAPGEVVTAPVAEIRLEFLDPVQPGAVIQLTGPDGDPVTPVGDIDRIDDGAVLVQRFEPVDRAGDHRVDYRYTALDGATQSGAYQFEVLAAASVTDGRGVAMTVTIVVVALSIVAAGVAVWRRRRSSAT